MLYIGLPAADTAVLAFCAVVFAAADTGEVGLRHLKYSVKLQLREKSIIKN